MLILGNSCDNETIGEYLGRPEFPECFSLEQPGKMSCDGFVMDIPAGITIPKTQEDFEAIRKYYMDREQSDFECRKFKRCERGKPKGDK